MKYCPNCGAETGSEAVICTKCGLSLTAAAPKSRLAAGLLGIFVGGFGVHRFYLGYMGTGIVQILVTLVTLGVGSLWGIIEGILILAGSFNRDAKGRPLRD
jgi:TM2 domain-containing membrane protein YozV